MLGPPFIMCIYMASPLPYLWTCQHYIPLQIELIKQEDGWWTTRVRCTNIRFNSHSPWSDTRASIKYKVLSLDVLITSERIYRLRKLILLSNYNNLSEHLSCFAVFFLMTMGHVVPEKVLPVEGPVTERAFERSFSSVCSRMAIEIALFHEARPTDVTRVPPFSSMDHGVDSQSFLGYQLATQVTGDKGSEYIVGSGGVG